MLTLNSYDPMYSFTSGHELFIATNFNAPDIRHIEFPSGFPYYEALTGFNDLLFSNFTEMIRNLNITRIVDNSFQNCNFFVYGYNDTTLTIPDCITNIGTVSFRNCDSFENIVFSSGITTINAGVASDNYSLKRVTIPVSITKIDDAAFAGSYDITDVHYSGSISQWNQIEFTPDTTNPASPLRFATIHRSDGDVAAETKPTPAPSPTPSSQDLYTIADGKTTFHVTVKTADAYKVDVRVYNYEGENTVNRGTGTETALPTNLDGVYKLRCRMKFRLETECELRLRLKNNR